MNDQVQQKLLSIKWGPEKGCDLPEVTPPGCGRGTLEPVSVGSESHAVPTTPGKSTNVRSAGVTGSGGGVLGRQRWRVGQGSKHWTDSDEGGLEAWQRLVGMNGRAYGGQHEQKHGGGAYWGHIPADQKCRARGE